MKKILLIGAVLILVLVMAVTIVAVLSLDGIVKKGVETIGSQVTRVSVNLDSVHIVLLKGTAEVKGFVVGNPDGFKTTQAINVGLAELGVMPASILSDKIVIRTIHVESPEITFEGGLGGNNLSKILDNVKAVAKTGGSASVNTDATPKTDAKPGKKIEVDDFLITGAKVRGTLVLPNGNAMTLQTLTLPDIHLADLGNGGDGLTPAELTRAVLSSVNAATIKAVTDNAAELGKGAKNLVRSAMQATGKDADKLKNPLNNVLGQ
jgi:hypothetical protein